jgi:hypothetical protein
VIDMPEPTILSPLIIIFVALLIVIIVSQEEGGFSVQMSDWSLPYIVTLSTPN